MTCPEDVAVLATRIGAATRRETYLVVKEAVTNVARHAHARHASIAIALVDGAIEATISDDGAGFAPDRADGAPSLGGNGLRNMKARVARCGGRFRVDAAPGCGTTIAVTMPLRNPRAGSA
jgi:signal transduction histidine kinase